MSSMQPAEKAAFSKHPIYPHSKPAREVQRAFKSLSSVQLTVQRALATTRELDERFVVAQDRAEASCHGYLEEHACEPDPEKLRQVRAELRSALLVADKKVQIVNEAYDVVDRQIERLDAALGQLQEDFGVPIGGFGGEAGPASSTQHSNAGGDGRHGGGRGRRGGSSSAAAIEPAAAAAANGASDMLDVEPEETFCSCGRVSFGEMVCCDNPTCPIEWFHFGCVGLEESPLGTWLCPICELLQNSSVKAIKRTAMREGAEAAKSPIADSHAEGGGGGGRSRGRGRGRGRGGHAATEDAEDQGHNGSSLTSRVGGRGSRGGRGRGRGRSLAMDSVVHNVLRGGKPTGRKGKHPVKECPACRGKHKAHTCGRGRNAMLARLAGDE